MARLDTVPTAPPGRTRGAPALACVFGLALAATTAGDAAADPPRLEVQEVAATGSMPKGASISPDGKRFYVTNFGQLNVRNITVYDSATLSPVDTIDVPGILVESVLALDGRTLFASNFRRNSVQFIDLARKTVTREIQTGTHPKVLALSPDGKQLFAANWASNSVTQIDVATGDVVRTLPVGQQPRGMAVTSKGVLYVANFWGKSIDIFAGPDFSQHHRIAACKVPRHLALSPDEKTLYVSCFTASQLHVLDLATEKVTHRIPIGSAPKSISVSRDGRYVYSADFGNTSGVSVVDTHDWTSRVFIVPGMDRGSGVVVTPDGRHALVTGWFDNHAYYVGFAGSGGHPVEAKRKIRGWISLPRHVGG